MKYETHSAKETQHTGFTIAQEILKQPIKSQASVVVLQGELGSGKTTFTQGFAAGLGIQDTVLSPTFLIIKSYPVPSSQRVLYHIDCYRIKEEHELVELGWQEIVGNPQNIILLEWPEHVWHILPKHTKNIQFETIGETQRKITL